MAPLPEVPERRSKLEAFQEQADTLEVGIGDAGPDRAGRIIQPGRDQGWRVDPYRTHPPRHPQARKELLGQVEFGVRH